MDRKRTEVGPKMGRAQMYRNGGGKQQKKMTYTNVHAIFFQTRVYYLSSAKYLIVRTIWLV